MYGFSALLHRMNYINRWGLMRNGRYETLSEHSLGVAAIAHLLACLAKTEYGADVAPERVACAAMYHDISEILTGDLPTPVKYKNERIRDEYKLIENQSRELITSLLPDGVKGEIGAAASGELLSDRENRIIKAADKLSALIKCIEEKLSGSGEFESAKKSTLDALLDDPLPETECFIKEFLPAYELTLDELLSSGE